MRNTLTFVFALFALACLIVAGGAGLLGFSRNGEPFLEFGGKCLDAGFVAAVLATLSSALQLWRCRKSAKLVVELLGFALSLVVLLASSGLELALRMIGNGTRH
jgi:hypothetical protein